MSLETSSFIGPETRETAEQRALTWPEEPWSLLSVKYGLGFPPNPYRIMDLQHDARAFSHDTSRRRFMAMGLVEYAAAISDSRVVLNPAMAKHISDSVLDAAVATKDYLQEDRKAIQRLTLNLMDDGSHFMTTLRASIDLYSPDQDEDQETKEQLRNISYTLARHLYLKEAGLTDEQISSEVKGEVAKMNAKKDDETQPDSVQ